MKIRGVFIEDTFAEAFTMRVARLIITGRSMRWAREAALKLTGFATSVIGCKCEAGIERELAEAETPDGRPGISMLLMTMGKDDMGKRLIERVGQTVLTCPTTACYDGLPGGAGPGGRGLGAALLRRRLPGEQGDRRRALLADPGHGGRVPGPGEVRHGEGRGRRQLPDPGPERRRGAGGGRGGGGCDRGPRRASSCRSPAAWSGAGARWARAGSRA